MNEQDQSGQPTPYDDEIDLRELFPILWAGKWLIGGITFGATVIAVIVALLLPNVYRAEALLAKLESLSEFAPLNAANSGIAPR